MLNIFFTQISIETIFYLKVSSNVFFYSSVTPQILLKLRWTFGIIFERALELFEGNKVSIFTAESTRHPNHDKNAYSFCEVKGQNSEVYTIFPHVNFCSCLAFE